jgi:type I restriction enzyme, S subunit
MEVKPGYKQTEVGAIPEEWDAQPLSAVCTIVGGGTPNTAIDSYWGGQIPWVSAGDISRVGRRYVVDTAQNISELGLESCPSRIVPAGTTVIIARGATVGRLAQLARPMSFNQTCYGVLPLPVLDRDFLYYIMSFSVTSVTAQSYGTIFGTITTNSFREWIIPFPPLPEQRAIATALSDVDALLGGLDRLIAKKRDLKQAAMQQLLTGQTRLPGFEGEWEVKSIGSFSTFVTKGSTPTTYGFNWVDDGILFLRSECVSADGLDLTQSMFISQAAHSALLRGEVRAGDILMTITGNVGRVVHLVADFGVANINQHIARIRVKDPKVSPMFVFYWLSQASVRDNYASITTGQAYPQISLKQVRETVIPIPSFSEQTAIAAALSDMDAELAALEVRRDKTRALKQAMMQELLTGRIRLVAREAAKDAKGDGS